MKTKWWNVDFSTVNLTGWKETPDWEAAGGFACGTLEAAGTAAFATCIWPSVQTHSWRAGRKHLTHFELCHLYHEDGAKEKEIHIHFTVEFTEVHFKHGFKMSPDFVEASLAAGVASGLPGWVSTHLDLGCLSCSSRQILSGSIRYDAESLNFYIQDAPLMFKITRIKSGVVLGFAAPATLDLNDSTLGP